jgi:hypothetical protein
MFLRGLPDAEACNPNEILGEQVSVGRAKTLADFVDIVQARLRSKPGPSSRFRECAINRFTTVDDAGVPRSSELVYQTPALMEDHIPAEADNPPIQRMLELAARFRRVRISGRMHTHPPEWSVFLDRGRWRYSLPGHSMGDLNFIAHNFGSESPLGTRLTSNFQPFVARIGPNGALQEVAYILMRPDLPAAPPSTFVPPPPPVPRGLPGAAGGSTVKGLLDLLRRRRR